MGYVSELQQRALDSCEVKFATFTNQDESMREETSLVEPAVTHKSITSQLLIRICGHDNVVADVLSWVHHQDSIAIYVIENTCI